MSAGGLWLNPDSKPAPSHSMEVEIISARELPDETGMITYSPHTNSFPYLGKEKKEYCGVYERAVIVSAQVMPGQDSVGFISTLFY